MSSACAVPRKSPGRQTEGRRNMKAKTEKTSKNSLAVAFFCAAVYFCSYLTRKDFAIALVAITEATGFSDSAIAAVPVCLFITYGIGQTVNGAIGDRLPPQYLITGGMLLSAACNFVLPLCNGVPAMCAVWGVNGFAQAMLWPPISKIMIYTYSGARYGTASMIVSLSASLATVTGYLYIPAVLSAAGWRAVFYVGAAIVVLCAAAWSLYSFRRDFIGKQDAAPVKSDAPAAKKEAAFPRAVVITLALILLDVVAVGMLRDGVETWMPTFIKESFGGGAEDSILISVMLALFSCLCVVLATYIYRRFFRNELTFCASVFAAAALLSVSLFFANGRNMTLSVICISLLAAVMHGSNLALTAYVPQRMKRFGHVCTVSGIVNSAVYIGAALSTYGAARIKEAHGWGAAIGVWIAISAAGILLSLASAVLWRKNVIGCGNSTNNK